MQIGKSKQVISFMNATRRFVIGWKLWPDSLWRHRIQLSNQRTKNKSRDFDKENTE